LSVQLFGAYLARSDEGSDLIIRNLRRLHGVRYRLAVSKLGPPATVAGMVIPTANDPATARTPMANSFLPTRLPARVDIVNCLDRTGVRGETEGASGVSGPVSRLGEVLVRASSDWRGDCSLTLGTDTARCRRRAARVSGCSSSAGSAACVSGLPVRSRRRRFSGLERWGRGEVKVRVSSPAGGVDDRVDVDENR
jgi:hypothetical protein